MSKNGKIIVFEGLDGSGKNTQSRRLFDELSSMGKSVKMISMPNYDSESSGPIKMYLNSQISHDPRQINPYATSSFFAVDRFINYFSDWKSFYERHNSIIICDRYTTSNMIYQLAKINRDDWDSFINWIDEYEYKYLQIPRPDLVIYLKVPIDVSHRLINLRSTGYDLHESNRKFLYLCEEAADFISKKLKWKKIDCSPDGAEILPLDYISSEVSKIVEENIL